MPEELAQAEAPSTQEPSANAIGESTGEQERGEPSSVGTDTRPVQPTNGQKPKEQLSRYERTKRQRAELARREAAIAQRESQFAQRERAAAEAAKPQRDYTLADLKKYRGQWAKDAAQGVWRDDYDPADLVEKADKEIAVMEAEAQANGQLDWFKAQWEAAERELSQIDPEFMQPGTRLDKRLREIMGSEDGNIYRQHQRGIIAAYHRAKMELLEGDFKALQTENSKLKTELQRYTGLTSIGGGAPARIGSGDREFSKLTLAEMHKHLRQGAKRDGVPWF
jgi:hypothetical protein